MTQILTLLSNLKQTWHYFAIAVLLGFLIFSKLEISSLKSEVKEYAQAIAEKDALIDELNRVSEAQDERLKEAQSSAQKWRKEYQAKELEIPDAPEDCEGIRKYLIEIAKNGPYTG